MQKELKMRQITIALEDYLYQFYRQIAQVSGKTVEQVVADTLFRTAGELSASISRNHPKKSGHK